MGVDATRSRNESVSIDYDGARPNDEIDAIARIGIAGAANPANSALADPDARDLHPVHRIKDDDIRDDEVAGVACRGPSKPDAIAARLREADPELIVFVVDTTGDPES